MMRLHRWLGDFGALREILITLNLHFFSLNYRNNFIDFFFTV